LLETGSIESLLHERLAVARVAKMQATRQKLSATGTPPMTAEEIEAEIQAPSCSLSSLLLSAR